jgi:hypothetical protein
VMLVKLVMVLFVFVVVCVLWGRIALLAHPSRFFVLLDIFVLSMGLWMSVVPVMLGTFVMDSGMLIQGLLRVLLDFFVLLDLHFLRFVPMVHHHLVLQFRVLIIVWNVMVDTIAPQIRTPEKFHALKVIFVPLDRSVLILNALVDIFVPGSVPPRFLARQVPTKIEWVKMFACHVQLVIFVVVCPIWQIQVPSLKIELMEVLSNVQEGFTVKYPANIQSHAKQDFLIHRSYQRISPFV